MMYRDYYTPPRETIINMIQFRKDYTKIKALTKTTHERYLLEIFRGMIIENAIKTDLECKKESYNKDGVEYD